MFKKSITSFLAVYAMSMALPQIASAQGAPHTSHAGGYNTSHNYQYLGGYEASRSNSNNRTPVTLGNGASVTTSTGSNVTTKWAKGYDHGCGCGETKPMMSDPYYVFFANDSSVISASGHAEIERAYHDAMHQGATQFKLSGHASTPGSQAYNMKLSSKRAATVTKELIKKGAAEHKIMTAAFGETVPYDKDTGMGNPSKDRRVELRYVYSK